MPDTLKTPATGDDRFTFDGSHWTDTLTGRRFPRLAGAEEPPEEKKPDGEKKPEEKAPEPKPEDTALGDAGKRALDAERAARKAAEKAAADALAKVKEFEEAQLSDAEKLTKRAEDAEKTASDATSRLARIEAAAKAGLPFDAADRLKGSTPEELEADAVALKALLGDGTGTTPPGPLDGGAKPPAPKQGSLDERIAEAQAKGDWKAFDRLQAVKLAKAHMGQA
jgi:hypothetical protein